MRVTCVCVELCMVRLTSTPTRGMIKLTYMHCSLDELVKDGVNGLVFNNADQLAAQLEVRLHSIPQCVLQLTMITEPSDEFPFLTCSVFTPYLTRIGQAH